MRTRPKPGVWGIIRVLDGAVRYFVGTQPETFVLLTPDNTGLIEPQQAHRVEPHGSMRMQVEFYDHRPTHHN